jgi:signal transduction histidine kinase/tetratricopeptide (TPR) repeat protein
MFKKIKHIAPRTKILFVAFILILLPGAVISYLSLQSIGQKAENLRTEYSGTVNLVRDKLENEITRLELNLQNRVTDLPPESSRSSTLQTWLRDLESAHPAYKNLFLVNTGGNLITSSVSLGWDDHTGHQFFSNPQTTESFNKAEEAEFIRKNLSESIRLYRDALRFSGTSQEMAFLISRIGRCYYKLGDYPEAIQEYSNILLPEYLETSIGNVPAAVVAYSQVASSYEAMQAYGDQYLTMVDLYKALLDRPWGLAGGDYLYYLNSVSKKLFQTENSFADEDSVIKDLSNLREREQLLQEQISFIKLIQKDMLPELIAALEQGSRGEFRLHTTSFEVSDSTILLYYYKLPAVFRQSRSMALGFQLNRDFVLKNHFPEVLGSVHLGKDMLVGIVGENDSILYLKHNHPFKTYLAAADFLNHFPSWKVALFDPEGKSIEQLAGKEKGLYLAVFIGIIVVMLIGIILMVYAVIHESEISRLKSDFVSNVSHELKTPLALIRMFGETLDSGIVEDEDKKREFYNIIRKESERLSHLINNVLDFSRMDAGVKEYNLQEADLVEVCRNSLEAYKFQLSDSGFKIESELAADPVKLKMDTDAVSQVLLNLFNNAVKYSDENKSILVKVWRNSEAAMISVKDNGLGIPKEDLKRIFDKFYRVSSPRTRETRGSGLGLTLAKHIVEAHGGSIEVQSEVGKGSLFTIRFPFK